MPLAWSLAPLRPSAKPALLNAISLVADAAKSAIVFFRRGAEGELVGAEPAVILVSPPA